MLGHSKKVRLDPHETSQEPVLGFDLLPVEGKLLTRCALALFSASAPGFLTSPVGHREAFRKLLMGGARVLLTNSSLFGALLQVSDPFKLPECSSDMGFEFKWPVSKERESESTENNTEDGRICCSGSFP